MDVTPRMRLILNVLLKEEHPISVKYLAEQIGVSKRTAQRELEYMNHTLKAYHIEFRSKTGVGIWLEGEKAEKEKLRLEINHGDTYDVSNREERRKRLVLEILKEKGLRKLFYYSSQFGVSEATISTDLESVESWLKKYGLIVCRKPGSGISIEGSEEDYRRAIRAFINENIDTKVLREAYETEEETEDSCESLQKSEIGQILNDDIVKRVIECISGMENGSVMTLTESSYVGLVIHISIAINRILKNEVIEPEEGWQEKQTKDEEYRLAERIVRELEEEFEIQIPEVEISYICLHIKGAKHEKIQWDGKSVLTGERRELQQLVNEMVDAFDYEKSYLLKQDDEFIQGLLAHLQPTMIRLLHGMQIQNPVLEDIQKNYPDIYRKCLNVAEVLEKKTGKPVPAEETGFLTVHFGAALVRIEGRSENIRKVNVGVICSSGIGISRLMASKLEKKFKDRMILNAYGKNDITPFVTGKTDFFISSIPLEEEEVPVIFVNPLLNEADMDEISRMTYQYERLPKKQKEKNEFSVQLEEINQIAAQINLVIKYMEYFQVDENIGFDELLDVIAETLSPYSDRRSLIREDIMKREKMSSQVFAEFGFALLHTRTKGVVRPTFAVCMTKNLGMFQDSYFKNIEVVFVMLVPVDEQLKINNDIMGHISATLIEDYQFIEVAKEGDSEKIRLLLSKHLKTYFSKYLSGLS